MFLCVYSIFGLTCNKFRFACTARECDDETDDEEERAEIDVEQEKILNGSKRVRRIESFFGSSSKTSVPGKI